MVMNIKLCDGIIISDDIFVSTAGGTLKCSEC